MSFQFNPDFRYRMPVVFGPASGPRQKPGGGMWTKEETGTMRSEWMAVSYRTDRKKLEALLPPGFSLRGEAIVTVSCAWFKDLYWLAGRGYGIVSVDFPVTYRGKHEELEGTFCPVIWEGQPDAIVTGREELGFPKLFANVTPISWDRERSAATCSASWFDHTFFEIELTQLTEVGGAPRLPGAGGGAAMYYKYMPRSSIAGREGADVVYVTTAAPPPGATARPDNISFDGFEFNRWNAKGSLAWNRATFEQLPLTFHIVNALADLDLIEFVNAELVTFSGPGIGISVNTMRAVEPA